MPTDQPRREFLKCGLAYGSGLLLVGGCLPRCLAAAASGAAADSPSAKPEDLEKLAYCGFECGGGCEVFRATRDNDLEGKKQIARGWKEHLGADVAPEKVACDGCRSNTGRLGYHCEFVCDVRRCARAKGVASCALCGDFPSCQKTLWRGWTAMHDLTAARYRARHANAQPDKSQ